MLGWKSGFSAFNLSALEQQFSRSTASERDFWDLNAKKI